jgi:hypothetical protein
MIEIKKNLTERSQLEVYLKERARAHCQPVVQRAVCATCLARSRLYLHLATVRTCCLAGR